MSFVLPSQRQERAVNLGTVVFFNKSKGFGFIKPDAGGVNIFFHINSGRAVRRSESGGQPELVKREELALPKESDIVCMLDIIPASGNKKNPTADLWVYEVDWRAMGGTIPVPGEANPTEVADLLTEEELLKGLEGLGPPESGSRQNQLPAKTTEPIAVVSGVIDVKRVFSSLSRMVR